MKNVIVVILLSLFNYSLQVSTPEDASYQAAVVECPLFAICNVTESLGQYRGKIKEAAKKGADIVVFPEKTLNIHCMSIPIPMDKINPIPADNTGRYSYVLVALSKAARDNNIYVVVNVQELLDCTVPQIGEECPEKRRYYFSTTIVFDRQGKLIIRTRKVHLFGEPFRTGSFSTDDTASFDTDFGVTFVILIQFDIAFQVPQMELIAQEKVTDVIFTTAWYNEFPFLSAVQTMQAISTVMDVNLLAANANSWDRDGAGGSGIFSGSAGTLISLIKKVDSCRLLMAEVPKTPGKTTKEYPGPIYVDPPKLDSIASLRDEAVDTYLTQDLKPGYQVIELAYQEIICKLIVNITFGSGDEFYKFKFASFDGVRKMTVNVTGGTRICAIMACTRNDIASCGLGLPKFSKCAMPSFHELQVIAIVPSQKRDPITNLADSSLFPTTLQAPLYSLQPDEVEYTVTEDNNGLDTIHTMSLKNFDAELYVFGFYGRKFTDDGKEAASPLIENIVVEMNREENA